MIFPHLRSCTLDIKKNPPTPAVTTEWNKNIYELTASRSFDACTWGRNLLSDVFICLMQSNSKVWKCKLWFLGHWFGGRWGNWGKTNAAYYVSKDILLTSIWRVNYFTDGLKDGLKDFVVLEPCRGFDRQNWTDFYRILCSHLVRVFVQRTLAESCWICWICRQVRLFAEPGRYAGLGVSSAFLEASCCIVYPHGLTIPHRSHRILLQAAHVLNREFLLFRKFRHLIYCFHPFPEDLSLLRQRSLPKKALSAALDLQSLDRSVQPEHSIRMCGSLVHWSTRCRNSITFVTWRDASKQWGLLLRGVSASAPRGAAIAIGEARQQSTASFSSFQVSSTYLETPGTGEASLAAGSTFLAPPMSSSLSKAYEGIHCKESKTSRTDMCIQYKK